MGTHTHKHTHSHSHTNDDGKRHLGPLIFPPKIQLKAKKKKSIDFSPRDDSNNKMRVSSGEEELGTLGAESKKIRKDSDKKKNKKSLLNALIGLKNQRRRRLRRKEAKDPSSDNDEENSFSSIRRGKK